MQDMLQQEGEHTHGSTSETTALVAPGQNLPAVAGTMTPAAAVDFAKEAARVLIDVVEQCGLAVSCGGKKKHIMLEGWSTVAKFYGCTIRCTNTTPVGDTDASGRYPGFNAKAEVVDRHGNVIGEGDGWCMRDEKTWKTRPNYALASMAQTRAASKAARVVFSWVVVLAGYEPTPSDEMPDEMKGGVVNTTERKAEKEHVGPLDPMTGGYVDNPKAISGLFDFLKRNKIEKDLFGEFLMTTRKVGDTELTRPPIEQTESGRPRWDKMSKMYFNMFKANKDSIVHQFFGWKLENDKSKPIEGSDVVPPAEDADTKAEVVEVEAEVVEEGEQKDMF